MITLEFDDLPLLVEGTWIAGTALIGQVDIDYDVCGMPWIDEIRLAADAKGKPDLVLKRHNAKPIYWDIARSVAEHMAGEISRNNPSLGNTYADEHRLRLHEVL